MQKSITSLEAEIEKMRAEKSEKEEELSLKASRLSWMLADWDVIITQKTNKIEHLERDISELMNSYSSEKFKKNLVRDLEIESWKEKAETMWARFEETVAERDALQEEYFTYKTWSIENQD